VLLSGHSSGCLRDAICPRQEVIDLAVGMTVDDPGEDVGQGIAGKSESTMRGWAGQHGLGRRIGGGTWSISRVALGMFRDGDVDALKAYHAGDRTSALVARYFHRALEQVGHAVSAPRAPSG
jgi:hypothetical protein